jgi:hypothetical protein
LEAEIRRIMVKSQPGRMVPETPSQKNPSQNKVSGVARTSPLANINAKENGKYKCNDNYQ